MKAMKALILNDTHLAVKRSAGVTPDSAEALQQFLFSEFERILMAHTDKALIHGGDLFDGMDVPNRFVLRAHKAIVNFLEASEHPVVLCRANHDWHPSGSKLSAWELLAEILKSEYPDRVQLVYGEFAHLWDNLFMIGHAANQDLLDMEINAAINSADGQPRKLFLHANWNNHFAEQSDASLNISEEQTRQLVDAGYQLIHAHEHQSRCVNLTTNGFTVLSKFDQEADVIILGNQTPSSIADCLSHGQAQKEGKKYAHVIEGKEISRLETWNNTGNFISVEWSDLARVEDQMFVRVTGKLSKEQSAEVLSVIAKFRSKSKAFVVSNNLKVEGVTLMESDDEFSAEDIRSFNIVEEFLALFSGKEQAVLKPILEDIK